MTTTLADLRATVYHMLGLTTDDGMVTAASVNTSINRGIRQMAVEFNWPWLIDEVTFNTVSGQNAYDPPEGWVKTMWVAVNDQELDTRQRSDLIQYDAENGMPRWVALYRQQLWLAPQPESDQYIIRHSYLRIENTLVEDSDTVLCPDQYSDVIAVYAAIIESRRLLNKVLETDLLETKSEWMKNISKNVPDADLLPRIKVRRDFPMGK